MIIIIQYINFLTFDGKSLLFRNYGSSDADRNLLTDVLKTFSEIKKESSLHEIGIRTTEKFKYFFTIINQILFIICVDINDNENEIRTKIGKIRAKFNDEFGELLSNAKLTDKRAIFTKIERDLDDIILGAIKVAIIGTGGVGKTDIIRLISGKDADLEYIPTINVDIAEADGKKTGLNRSIMLWNFAGYQNYRSLWKSLLGSTDIALLVLDSSFENVKQSKEIIEDILDKYYKDVLVIGIANKQNLPNRLTPEFIEKFLSHEREYHIKVHGFNATDPQDREKILKILRDAINTIYPGVKSGDLSLNLSDYIIFDFRYNFDESHIDLHMTSEISELIDGLNKRLKEWGI